MMMCDRGTLDYIVEPSSAMPTGFSGSFDAAPLELAPGDALASPVLGTITGEAYSCLSSTSFTIRLQLETPHAGEQLYFEVAMDDVCEIAAGYFRDVGYTEAVPVDIDVKFVSFDPPYDFQAETFMQGGFSARVAEPLGYTIAGTFSVAGQHLHCLI